MSELKARKFFEAVPTSKAGFYQPGAFVEGYLKAEADKEIAEKDKEIARLNDKALQYKVLDKEHCRDLNTQERRFALQIAHHKYKRCLAMARWCHNQREIYERDSYDWELDRDAVVSLRNKANIMRRWCKRWLELAEEPTWAKFLQLIHKEVKQ